MRHPPARLSFFLAIAVSFLAGSLLATFSQAVGTPNPGHGWDQLECTSALCVTSQAVGLGSVQPPSSAKLTIQSGGSANRLINAMDQSGNPVMLVDDTGLMSFSNDNGAATFTVSGGDTSIGTSQWVSINLARPGLQSGIQQRDWSIQNSVFGSGVLSFQSPQISGNPQMVIDETGRVGIGTADPQYTLDVQGSIRVTGTAAISGVPGLVRGGGNDGDIATGYACASWGVGNCNVYSFNCGSSTTKRKTGEVNRASGLFYYLCVQN